MTNPAAPLVLLGQLSLADSGGAGAFAGMAALLIVIILIAAAASIFWIWMLIDCLKSNLPSGEKLLWGLIIFFGHLLGAVLYFAIARRGARRVAG
jgi:hypothetical protein